MPLVNTKMLMLAAKRSGYAIPAFNIENMEMLKAVMEAASRRHAPVIIQATPKSINHTGIEIMSAGVIALGRIVSIPVVLHLDHGKSYMEAAQAIRAGFTSVMIDASDKSFEENIAITKSVVELAHYSGVTVEAELGHVGGKEDDSESEGDKYTDPEKAREFVERTGVDSLAVAVGTAHGFYKEDPKIDYDRLEQINEAVDIPLVLHGASGLNMGDITECIIHGVSKVNFATELRRAYTDGVKAALDDQPELYDPKILGRAGMASVRSIAGCLIGCCAALRRFYSVHHSLMDMTNRQI